jgi:hypothetical protein
MVVIMPYGAEAASPITSRPGCRDERQPAIHAGMERPDRKKSSLLRM